MALKLLQITAPMAATGLLEKLAREFEAISFHRCAELEEEHGLFLLLARPRRRQELLDALYDVLKTSSQARVVVCPVDATVPNPKTISPGHTREELYQQLMLGAEVNRTYLILGALSTFVALIGLLQDNVAVVIGAMVIAPLLGPNLALAFGTALHDKPMVKRALVAGLSGLLIAILLSAATGMVWQEVPDSSELLSRTRVGFDGVALAIASGIAGVLSLTTGLSMTLVGVMVAVALAPPAATLGFMLGVGNMDLAMGAALLLAVNIVCVNLSALTVFLAKGFKTREIFARRIGLKYIWLGVIGWSLALAGLLYFISITGQ